MADQRQGPQERSADTDRPCPRCGTMRPRAATFCSNCGQDLRSGAPVGATAGKTAPAVRRAPRAPLGGPDIAEPPAAAPPPQQRTISRPPSAAPEAPASFTERYRGTAVETPESKIAGPPPGSRAAGARRYGRIVGAATLVVLVVAGALAGASSVLLPGANASPTPGALGASSSPGSSDAAVTPLLVAGTTFGPPEAAQVAFCLSAVETDSLDAAIAALQAQVKVAQHAAIAAAASDLASRVTEMRLAAAEMAAWTTTKAYAAAYDAALRAAVKATAALQTAAASGSVKGETVAAAALAAAQKQLHAADPQRTKLLAAAPELSCVPAG
ncbi:MAG: hypothetical protein ACXWOW_05005 [Candidatus Limnocylindrales bacterium]